MMRESRCFGFARLISRPFICIVFCAVACEDTRRQQDDLDKKIRFLEQQVDQRLFPERLSWMPREAALIYAKQFEDSRVGLFASPSGLIVGADRASIRRHTTHPESTAYLSASFWEEILHREPKDFKCIHWDEIELDGATATVTTFRLLHIEVLTLRIRPSPAISTTAR